MTRETDRKGEATRPQQLTISLRPNSIQLCVAPHVAEGGDTRVPLDAPADRVFGLTLANLAHGDRPVLDAHNPIHETELEGDHKGAIGRRAQRYSVGDVLVDA